MSPAPDWRQLDLTPGGRSLIEASAGTGKTWTIGVLYLRLLLENMFAPRRIVVATFTNAAAAELKERLRARIEQALALAQAGIAAAPDDSATDLCFLHARWQGNDACRHDDATRLALALAELDIAPIGTLHGLCTRILAEHPFAAGAAFRTPELVDAGALRDQLADDLWRVLHGEGDAGAALRQAAEPVLADLSRQKLAALLKLLMQPGVRVSAPVDVPMADQQAWADLLVAVTERTDLFKSSRSALRSRWQEIARYLGTPVDARDPSDLRNLGKLDACLCDLEKQLKPAACDDAQVMAALELSQTLVGTLEALLDKPRLSFLATLQHEARTQLDLRLARANQLGFDDLLTTVLEALRPDAQGNRVLADALFAQWPVAMIDEFQDTDPNQYGILDAIYRQADAELRGRLLLIGDPKQAIYRFRGGDIHTYERACDAVAPNDRLLLDTNRRSSHAYVAAINALYARIGEKLGAPDSPTTIRYRKVQASASECDVRFTHQEQPADALSFHDDSADPPGDDTGALLSCASRIAAMLDPSAGWRIDGRPLCASDVCVLVPRNHDAQRMVAFLRQRGIATVNRGRASVFHGETARDLLRVLDAVAHCEEPRRVRAAVATQVWGLGYHDLRTLREDAIGWQALTTLFHQWHHNWNAAGVLAVVLALMQRVATQHLATRDGERVLTDLRHLGELLQDAEDRSDGMASLLAWFRHQIESGESGEDAAEAQALRLESDARCAQVMTLHASKGLEFNLVFLPLMGEHRGPRSLPDIGLLVKEDGSRKLVLDTAARSQAAMEEQDERFRVLYVALTRARFATQVWLPSAEASATDKHAAAAPLALCAPQIRAARDVAFTRHIGWPPIEEQRVPSSGEVAELRCARALPAPRQGPLPMRHSFTTLVAHAGAGLDPGAPALDEDGADGSLLLLQESIAAIDPEPLRTRATAIDALLGVAGSDFGNAVHDVLEHRRVGTPLRDQQDMIRTALDAYAVRHPRLSSEAFAQHLATRLDGVLEADLDGAGLRLAALPARDLRCEMAFHYLLDGASLARLRAGCEAVGYPNLIPSREDTLSGLMNGKIDVVFRHDGRFHVLDWKGNNLGRFEEAFLEDYAPPALDAAMQAASYRFQALLYTVALERYLVQRLGSTYRRAEHLGDAWYLFIRATGLHLPDGTPCGIWRHRFSDALLDVVQGELSRNQERAA